jgi:hypothetical protein
MRIVDDEEMTKILCFMYPEENGQLVKELKCLMEEWLNVLRQCVYNDQEAKMSAANNQWNEN